MTNLIKSKKIMDYINKDMMNKDLYRSYLMLQVFLWEGTLGRLNYFNIFRIFGKEN